MTAYVQKEENTVLDSTVINFHVSLTIQTNFFFHFLLQHQVVITLQYKTENSMSHEIFFDWFFI